MNSSIKFLIYDLLELINANKFETYTNIQQRLKSGEIVDYLLKTYAMTNLRKVDTQKAVELLKEKMGVFDNNLYEEKNGFLYLIEILLDC